MHEREIYHDGGIGGVFSENDRIARPSEFGIRNSEFGISIAPPTDGEHAQKRAALTGGAIVNIVGHTTIHLVQVSRANNVEGGSSPAMPFKRSGLLEGFALWCSRPGCTRRPDACATKPHAVEVFGFAVTGPLFQVTPLGSRYNDA